MDRELKIGNVVINKMDGKKYVIKGDKVNPVKNILGNIFPTDLCDFVIVDLDQIDGKFYPYQHVPKNILQFIRESVD